MKRLLILMLIAFTTTAQAQRLDTARYQHMTDHELGMNYLNKSRSQKAAAWILLGSGVIVSQIGLNATWDLNRHSASDGEMAVVAGTLAMVASIPLFISGAKNKGRAEILLRNQNVPMAYKYQKQVTGLGLNIAIGR